ncbi:hypothetical protein ABRY23_03975 [Melioribacteraceae bacterium 4301-Me]
MTMESQPTRPDAKLWYPDSTSWKIAWIKNSLKKKIKDKVIRLIFILVL